jgi:hypothetical protein
MTKIYKVEYDLVIEACKIEPDYEQIQHCLKNIDDWTSFLDISYAHGVLPLVYKTLKKQKDFPPKVLSMFKSQNIFIAQANMQMTAELIKIVTLLNAENIEIIAFKGPTLSQSIHGNVLDRQYTDIDILIAENNLFKAAKILANHHYESEHSIEFLKNKTLLKIEKDFTLYNTKNKISVELHWKLFENKLVYKSNLNYFKEDGNYIVISGLKIKVLNDEQLLLYLALHGSKHYWERIEWVVDIDRLIRGHTINWEKLVLLAQQLEIENIFYFCLSVSDKMFDTPIPKDILHKIENHGEILKSNEKVFEMIYLNKIGDPQLYTKLRFATWKKLQDNRKNNYIIRSKFLLQLISDDVYTINLPYALSPLYYLIAYFRTIKRYATKIIELRLT